MGKEQEGQLMDGKELEYQREKEITLMRYRRHVAGPRLDELLDLLVLHPGAEVLEEAHGAPGHDVPPDALHGVALELHRLEVGQEAQGVGQGGQGVVGQVQALQALQLHLEQEPGQGGGRRGGLTITIGRLSTDHLYWQTVY